MIPQFIKKWEEGYKLVIGVKAESEESPIFFAIRKLYYKIIGTLSEIDIIKNFTGFGLYDQKVIEILRHMMTHIRTFVDLFAKSVLKGQLFYMISRLENRGIHKK